MSTLAHVGAGAAGAGTGIVLAKDVEPASRDNLGDRLMWFIIIVVAVIFLGPLLYMGASYLFSDSGGASSMNEIDSSFDGSV